MATRAGASRAILVALVASAATAGSSAAPADAYLGPTLSFPAVAPPAVPGRETPPSPADIAVAGDGTAYVTFGSFVQVYGPTGRLVSTFGGPGSGDGQFGGDASFPVAGAIDVGPDGAVYVADPRLNRIQKFSPSGAFVARWGRNGGDGSAGSGAGEFENPYDLAAAATGLLVVDETRDQALGRLQRLTLDGVSLTSRSVTAAGFVAPAAGGDFWFRGYMFPDLTRLRASDLTSVDSFLTVGPDERRPGDPRQPPSCCGVAAGSDSVWVGDLGQARVERYSPAGRFIEACGDESSVLYTGQRIASGPQDSVYVLKDSQITRYQDVKPPAPACDATPPRLYDVALSRSVIKRHGTKSRRSTTLRFAVSEAAKVTLQLLQIKTGHRAKGRCSLRARARGKRCQRALKRKSSSVQLDRGMRARIRVTGRAGRRWLPPGPYRVRVTASDAAQNPSMPATIALRIR